MMRRVHEAAVAGAVAALACIAVPACTEPRSPREVRIASAIGHSDFVFKGRVQSLGPPPEGDPFHGHYVTQSVTLAVEEVLLGEPSKGARVVIHMMVVGDSRTAEPGKKELSKTLFRKGAVLLLMTQSRADQLVSVDEDFGTLEATPENEARIRDLIRDRENR